MKIKDLRNRKINQLEAAILHNKTILQLKLIRAINKNLSLIINYQQIKQLKLQVLKNNKKPWINISFKKKLKRFNNHQQNKK
jgi:hypothetical protein